MVKGLNINKVTIRQRIDNLLKKGFIRDFADLLNYNKIEKILKTIC